MLEPATDIDLAARIVFTRMVKESGKGYLDIDRETGGQIKFNRVRDICTGIRGSIRVSELFILCHTVGASYDGVSRLILEISQKIGSGELAYDGHVPWKELVAKASSLTDGPLGGARQPTSSAYDAATDEAGLSELYARYPIHDAHVFADKKNEGTCTDAETGDSYEFTAYLRLKDRPVDDDTKSINSVAARLRALTKNQLRSSYQTAAYEDDNKDVEAETPYE